MTFPAANTQSLSASNLVNGAAEQDSILPGLNTSHPSLAKNQMNISPVYVDSNMYIY